MDNERYMTIKELADELQVSKDKIKYRAGKLPGELPTFYPLWSTHRNAKKRIGSEESADWKSNEVVGSWTAPAYGGRAKTTAGFLRKTGRTDLWKRSFRSRKHTFWRR